MPEGLNWGGRKWLRCERCHLTALSIEMNTKREKESQMSRGIPFCFLTCPLVSWFLETELEAAASTMLSLPRWPWACELWVEINSFFPELVLDRYLVTARRKVAITTGFYTTVFDYSFLPPPQQLWIHGCIWGRWVLITCEMRDPLFDLLCFILPLGTVVGFLP